MYKAKHNLCPRPIFNLFQPSNYTYQLRQTDSVALSRVNTTTYGKHSLRYLGPKLWRNLSRKGRLAILIPLNRKNKRDLSSLLKYGSVYRLLSMQFLNFLFVKLLFSL